MQSRPRKMDARFLEALMQGLDKNRSTYDKAKLEKLAKSTDPKDKDILNTMIMDIIESDDLIALEVILEHQDIDVTSKDYDGKTCLSIAASAGSTQLVELFLERMTSNDIRNYNDKNLLSLDFPKILPDLYLVEDVMSIIELLLEKGLIFTLEHKLTILEFFVHNTDDCDCGNPEMNSRDLQKNVSDLMIYGSPIHIDKIVRKICEKISAQTIELSMTDLIESIGRPFSHSYWLRLYYEKDYRTVLESIEKDWKIRYPYTIDYNEEYRLLSTHQLKKNNKLSLHDLLKKNPRETHRTMSKIDIHKIRKKYKFAGDWMKGLKAKSLIRHIVEEFVGDFVRVIWPFLPDSCLDKIVYYVQELSNEDMLSICQVGAYICGEKTEND